MVNVAIAVMKYHDQKQIEGKGLIWLILPFHHSSSIQGKNSGRKRSLEPRPVAEAMEECCYWFVYHDFLSILSYRTQSHKPRDANTHNGQILSHQEVIKKIHGH